MVFKISLKYGCSTGAYTFSANLKREYLRENEHLLVRKYSRFPEEQFVLFGTIAQSPSTPVGENDENTDVDNASPSHIKEAVMGLVEALSGIEDSFFGKLANEIIVDPIALYREI